MPPHHLHLQIERLYHSGVVIYTHKRLVKIQRAQVVSFKCASTTSFVLGGFGGFVGKSLDSYLVNSWISGIPQYIRPQGYNLGLGALLNPAPVINVEYVRSVLVKDVASGLTGTGTETLTKEAWDKVNAK